MQETWVPSLGREDSPNVGPFQSAEWALVKWLTGTAEVVDQALNDPYMPGSLEGNTEGPGTASSEPLLPS